MRRIILMLVVSTVITAMAAAPAATKALNVKVDGFHLVGTPSANFHFDTPFTTPFHFKF